METETIEFAKIYLWQSNLALLLLYAVYWVFLRRDTFFRWNRLYLLVALVFALAFPFLPVPTLFQEAVPEDQVLLLFGENEVVSEVTKTEVVTSSPTLLTWENALLVIYGIGALLLFIRLIYSLFTIFKLIFSHSNPLLAFSKTNREWKGYFIVQTKAETPIFSFLNVLFWNENPNISEEEKAKILAHELVHIRQWHSLDVLFVEILTIVFWYNPIIWAYRKSLQAVHEYLADAHALRKGMSRTEYANLLVSQFLQTDTLYLTNHFLNKSLLKNRIMMLHQRKSTQKALTKFAFALPILAMCLLVAACTKELNNLQVAQFDFPKGFEIQQKYTLSNSKTIMIEMDSSYSYMVRMSNPRNNYQGIILTLSNLQNEEVAISKVNNRYFNGWTYMCKQMGKYRMVVTMENGADEETVVSWAKRKNIMKLPNKTTQIRDVKASMTQTFELDKNKYNQCTVYAYLEGEENKSLKDYNFNINVYKPNGEEIGSKNIPQSRGVIFPVKESGTYQVEVTVTEGNLPNNLKLKIEQRLIEKSSNEEQTTNATPTKSEPSPWAGVKEYDAPLGKESEYSMVLAKNVMYEFRVIKGEAEIAVVRNDEKDNHFSKTGKLVVKDLAAVGIYKLRIVPKGDADAKVTFSIVKE